MTKTTNKRRNNRKKKRSNSDNKPQAKRSQPKGPKKSKQGGQKGKTTHKPQKEGQKQESVDYHNIVVFGRQAETVAQYLKKGSSALVEGRMQTRSWESDGVKKYRTEIVADRVQFGPRGAGSGTPTATVSTQGADVPQAQAPAPADIEYPEEDIKPEDIPF